MKKHKTWLEPLDDKQAKAVLLYLLNAFETCGKFEKDDDGCMRTVVTYKKLSSATKHHLNGFVAGLYYSKEM